MKNRVAPTILSIAWFFLAAAPAGAQSQAVSTAELQNEITQLKAKVDALEIANRQLEGLKAQVKVIDNHLEAEQEKARKEGQTKPMVEAGVKGFRIRSADDAYTLRIGGWIQADGRFYNTGTKPSGSTFVMRRVRPYLDGTVGRFFDYRVLVDFGQGVTTLQDAFVDVHYWPEFRLRTGKFKEPVGLERLQDDRYLMFVERALTANLVPDRDLGAELHGELFGQRFEYRLGVFNGVPDNTASPDIDNNDAKDFAGRIFIRPFGGSRYEFAQQLGLGLAGTYGRERSTTLDTYRSAGQTTFFTFAKGVNASGDRFRLAPQLNYYRGPFGFQSEFVENTQRVSLVTAADSKARTLSNQAWQVAGTYLITGENARYAAAVEPRQDFNPLSGGFGAWELAARVDQLLVDRDAFNYGEADPSTASREAFEWDVGVNWYLNRNVKLMTDYERTNFIWGAPHGHNREAESAILTELQLMY